MQLTNLLPLLLPTLALAAPTTTTAPQPPTQNITLRTSHATHPRHNNLYLSSYHTGAGEADAVFQNTSLNARVGSLNATDGTFVFSSGYEHLNPLLTVNGTSPPLPTHTPPR